MAAFALGFVFPVCGWRGEGKTFKWGCPEGFGHCADVVNGVPTASTDDGCTEIANPDSVLGHLFGGSVVVGVPVYEFGHSSVGFGDEGDIEPDGGHGLDDAFDFAWAIAAVAAEGEGVVCFDRLKGLDGADAHHGMAVGVEGHGDDEGEGAGFPCAFSGGADFLEVAHGFDPEDICSAFGKGGGLFGKGGFDIFKPGFAEREEDFSTGTHGPANYD